MISNKMDFLRKCSQELDPVECVNVESGSIIVTVQGSEEQIAVAKEYVSENGLDLPGYDPFTYSPPEDAKEDNDEDELFGYPILVVYIAGGAAALLLLLIIICICRCFCCTSSTKTVEFDCTTDGPGIEMTGSNWTRAYTSDEDLQVWGATPSGGGDLSAQQKY